MCIKKVDTPHCLKQQMLGDGTYMKKVLKWFDPMQAPTPNFLVTEQISHAEVTKATHIVTLPTKLTRLFCVN